MIIGPGAALAIHNHVRISETAMPSGDGARKEEAEGYMVYNTEHFDVYPPSANPNNL